MIVLRPGRSRTIRAARTHLGSTEPAASIAAASVSTAVNDPAATSLIGALTAPRTGP
jgi:hypothetical protein